MDIRIILSTYLVIFIAELPDKTALATLMMATRGQTWPIFVGVAAAFTVQCIVAVVFGSFIGKLPQAIVRASAGILFLVFAFMAWKRSQEPEEQEADEKVSPAVESSFRKAAMSAFMMIFIAEWGDLTQLATASLAARTNAAWSIFTGSLLALWSVTGIAIFLGHHAHRMIKPKQLQKWSALVFAIIGIIFLIRS